MSARGRIVEDEEGLIEMVRAMTAVAVVGIEALDQIIAPLLYSYSGTRERDTPKAAKVDRSMLYPQGVFYPELKKMGVAPYVFGSRDYTPSTFSKSVMEVRKSFVISPCRRS